MTIRGAAGLGIAILGLTVSGCIFVDNTPPAATVWGVYETCDGSGSCQAGSTCAAANSTADGFQGTFCTAGCDTMNPVCPQPANGSVPVCVPNGGGSTSGQCYSGCGSGCSYGETCGTMDGAVYFCVP